MRLFKFSLGVLVLATSVPAFGQSDVDQFLDDLVSKAVHDGQPYRAIASEYLPEPGKLATPFENPTVLDSVDKLYSTLHDKPRPGNYALPVTLFALMFGQHQPADGQSYRLGRLEGKRSRLINLLTVRATMADYPPNQINAILWRLEAGIALPHLPKDDQGLIHTLIADYESRLKPDYIDGIHSKYRNVSLLLGGKSFEDELASLGPNGKEALFYYRSRKTLLAKDISLDDLPQRMMDSQQDGQPLRLPKIEKAADAPWAEVASGVDVRLAVYDGIWKQNWLEIHVDPDGPGGRVSPTSLGDFLGLFGVETGAKLSPEGLNALVGYSQDDNCTPVMIVPHLVKVQDGG